MSPSDDAPDTRRVNLSKAPDLGNDPGRRSEPAAAASASPPAAPMLSGSRRTPKVAVLLIAASVLLGAVVVAVTGGERNAPTELVGAVAAGPQSSALPSEDPGGDGLGTAAQTAEHDADEFSFQVTTEADWTVPDEPDVKSDGAMRVWDLFGPDGEEISIYHTPDERAAPGRNYVVDRSAFSAQVSDAERIVLDGFPTPACEAQECDDYVLNGSFGGIAILAADHDGPISAVAADIARSIRPR